MRIEKRTSKDFVIEIDMDTSIYDGIDFEKDEVHVPDTSLFVGIFCGKMNLKTAIKAKEQAGFRFFKVVSKTPNAL